MPVVNADIAAALDEIADLLEVQGANAFRIRAYRNAARTVGELGRSVRAMLEGGEALEVLPGIGADLAGKIAEIARRGSCAQLDELRSQVPPAVTELLRLPGIGPKRVQALRRELGIDSVRQLHEAAAQGRVAKVPGFGPKTQQMILDAASRRLDEGRRVRLAVAAQVADALLAELKAVPGVREAVAAGSLRRRRDTVGDLDLLVVADRASPVMQRFTSGPDVRSVIARGATRASVVLRDGLQVDLRAVPPASLGAAWVYFTGSKAHNIALRRMAQDRGMKLNEYGLFSDRRRVAGASEEDVYRALGLPWIPPELREDRGEIDAAREHRLPKLVERAHLRGDLHVHTTASDGRDAMEVMCSAARASGLEYIAITDHSRRLALVHGLDAARLARQIDQIDALNERGGLGITLLKGIEVDILEDGRLDLPDAVLRRLDLVVGAVHHKFDLPPDKQTARVLRAMDHPSFTILAHPTGRLLGERAGYAIDMQRVVRHARERGCFLELNAHPARLDIDDVACRMARDEGVLVSIATDAHSAPEFSNLAFGVGQARRGWLEAKDVLNARPLGQLRPLIDAAMGRPARVSPSRRCARRARAPATAG